jgi:short-subunit dehydrogenase
VADVPIAAVTGASRGIGHATALDLARAGYRVFALARTLTDLQSLAEEGRGMGGEIVPVELDIADERSRAQAAEEIMRRTDGYGLDVLVNNAGYGLVGAMEDIPEDALRRLFDVNFFGLLSFTQPFLPGMRERRHGRIVNMSSAAGRVSTPFMGAYSATKFALEAVSDAMRLELAPFGVYVVSIEPGPIPTHFGRAREQVAPEGSAYARFLRRYTTVHDRFTIFARSPAAVARLVLRAVQAENPRPRYTITVGARAASLERFAPTRLRDAIMRRVMGLNSNV